jgi:hypothetical protein
MQQAVIESLRSKPDALCRDRPKILFFPAVKREYSSIEYAGERRCRNGRPTITRRAAESGNR